MEEYRIDPTIAFDVVPLPSGGIHYPNKKKALKVAYLTAADENILVSPNLIETNMIIEELLKRKILDHDLSIEDIVDEDRDAILIFLRNTAFGPEYVMNLLDSKTNKPFSHTINLESIPIKDFKLEEDVNGEYQYFLQKSQVPITFKFLNKKQQVELENIKNNWSGTPIAPVETKKLEMMIKSVGGVRDAMQIYQFIEKMPIKDSQDFKKFVNDNRPGLDLTQKVTTPSGEEIQFRIVFGVEFFRPFFGL